MQNILSNEISLGLIPVWDLYKKYGANHEIEINGIGKRYIQDIHGTSKKVIDIFVDCGRDGKCACSRSQNDKYNQKGVYVEF